MILGIYGSGGAGKEVFDLLQESPKVRALWQEAVFIDDTVEAGEFWGLRRFPFADFRKIFAPEEVRIVIAVGEPKNREMLYERVKAAGYSLATLVHDTAIVSEGVKLGEGVVLQEGVRVSAEAELGENTFVNHRAMIGHNTRIGKHCQLSASVMIAGKVSIGDVVFAGVSCCMRDRIAVGSHSILSMGAVVLKDVRPHRIVLGNPAREIAENKEERVFSD